MDKTIPLKQPSGLYVLFSSELWERFGFYCVQSLLVLYFTGPLGMTDKRADALYSAFTGLLYASPVIGGFLADTILGFRRAIILGALFYIVGYFLMLSHSEYAFYVALSLLICGNGYFKANISSLLGTFYHQNDSRRDSGFTIFYLGINLGTLFGPVVASIVTIRYGYHYGFAMCGIGMLIGLITFLWGRRFLGDHGIYPTNEKHAHKNHALKNKERMLVYGLSVIAALILSRLIYHTEIIDYSITLFCVASVIYLLFFCLKFLSRQAYLHVIGLLILFGFSILFWAFYFQLYTSVTLFTERNVDRMVGGWTIPTPMLQSIIPIFVVLLCPFAAKLWIKLEKEGRDFSFGLKFCLAHFFQGISFFVLVLGIYFEKSNQMALIWLFVSGFFRVLGELTLSPIGLSAVTKLAPPALTGMVMGLWFLTIAGGLVLSNELSLMANVPRDVTSLSAKLTIYQHAFFNYGGLSFLTAFALLFFLPVMKKLTN